MNNTEKCNVQAVHKCTQKLNIDAKVQCMCEKKDCHLFVLATNDDILSGWWDSDHCDGGGLLLLHDSLLLLWAVLLLIMRLIVGTLLGGSRGVLLLRGIAVGGRMSHHRKVRRLGHGPVGSWLRLWGVVLCVPGHGRGALVVSRVSPGISQTPMRRGRILSGSGLGGWNGTGGLVLDAPLVVGGRGLRSIGGRGSRFGVEGSGI